LFALIRVNDRHEIAREPAHCRREAAW
jgi:hypothetical protein